MEDIRYQLRGLLLGIFVLPQCRGVTVRATTAIKEDCPALSYISYGTFNSSDVSYGSVVKVTCDAGYQLVGNSTIECLYNYGRSYWSSENPTCVVYYNVNLAIGLCAAAAFIVIFSIVTVIVCAMRSKKQPESTRSTGSAVSSTAPTTVIMQQNQPVQQPFAVAQGSNAAVTATPGQVRDDSSFLQANIPISEAINSAPVIVSGDAAYLTPMNPDAGRATGAGTHAGAEQPDSGLNHIYHTEGSSNGVDYETRPDNEYLVPVAEERSPDSGSSGTGSRNASGQTDADYLEVLPDENTPSRDQRARDPDYDHEYNYIPNIDTRARLQGPDSPPIYECAEPPSLPASVSSTSRQPRAHGERVIPAPPAHHHFGIELGQQFQNSGGYVNDGVNRLRTRANKN